MMDVIANGPPGAGTTLLVTTTVITTLAVISALRLALYPSKQRVIDNPLKTVVSKLSEKQVAQLEYRPDDFPGARDVATPYGSIRVYEWGPETGEKVLMVHGISTSCQTLIKIAESMVAKGYRVMLFDLFGRGFSDGVGDLPHDSRLYMTQMLLVLASSSLPWTGDAAFHLVGYSMGGGVAVNFAAAFPHMVRSLILLAPAGMIRDANFNAVTRFVFTAGLVPERLLAAVTKWRLQKPIAGSAKKRKDQAAEENPSPSAASSTPSLPLESAVDAALAEAVDPIIGTPVAPLEARVLRYVRWMLDYHDGFVPAFMSCIRHAPLVDQHDAYRALARREKGTTLFIFGRSDDIIVQEDYAEDALPLVGGKEHVRWEMVPGGHDFPMSHAEYTLEHIYRMLDGLTKS